MNNGAASSAERRLAELSVRKPRSVRRRWPAWLTVRKDRVPHYLLLIAVLVALLSVAYYKRAFLAESFVKMRKKLS